ncbi:MAG: hypothetical protein FD123_2776 [Bacteroidetes bacterium]|nr:MAG: hypothetical protein FD123_2776 [Bacteroidota bacterium]
MKNTSVIYIAIALAGSILNSQKVAAQVTYYHRDHILSVQDIAIKTDMLGAFPIVTGSGLLTNPVTKKVIDVVRYSQNGSSAQTSNTFSSHYELKQGAVTLDPLPVGVSAPGATSATPTQVIVVAGGYLTSSGLFVLTLNGDGSVRSAKEVIPAISNATVFKVTAVGSEPMTINGVFRSDHVFIAGTVTTNSIIPKSGQSSFVLSMNTVTNTINWFRVYNLDSFSDAVTEVEEPASIAINSNTVFIAGNATASASANQAGRGFVFTIDPANGNITGQPFMIDFERTTRIKAISRTNVGSPELPMHLAGETSDIVINDGDTRDAWAATIKTTIPAVEWCKQYDYSAGGDNVAGDCDNSGGRLYLAGTASNGTVNGTDMVALRLDPADGTVEFEATYGKAGNDIAAGIEQHFANGGFWLAGSNQNQSQPGRFSIVSAYHNGASGCNESVSTTVPVNLAATVVPTTAVMMQPSASTFALSVVRTNAGVPVTDCFNTSLPDGDNSHRPYAEPDVVQEDAAAGVNLYPNPVSTSGVLHIDYIAAGTIPPQVEIYDAAGRKIVNRAESTPGGGFLMQPGELAPGAYLVLIREGDRTIQQKLLVY